MSLSERMRDMEISFVSTSVCLSTAGSPNAKAGNCQNDDSLRPEDLFHLRKIDFDKFAL